MKMKDSIDCAEQLLLKTYNRYQVVFDHGDGIKLFDTDGNEYLDFFAGIAVQGLGYNYNGVNEALKAQAEASGEPLCLMWDKEKLEQLEKEEGW